MPIVQFIITFFTLIAFLLLAFVLAWYIAIPLLILWAVSGGIRWLQLQWQHYRDIKQSNGCTIRRVRPRTNRSPVIDVDYTEIPSD